MLQKNYPMDTEQEKAAELAAQQEVKEDEVRAKVIEEFGFDETNDQEKIDKLVAKEVDHRKSLSAAIGQKIKYRSEAEELKKTPPKPPTTEAPKVAAEDVGKVVAQELEKRDLESLEYPDDLKKEIQRIAQIQGVSVKQASRDPYIVAKIEMHAKEKQAEEATITRTNKSGSRKSYSVDSPPEVDMTTVEGRKEWDNYLDWMKKQGN